MPLWSSVAPKYPAGSSVCQSGTGAAASTRVEERLHPRVGADKEMFGKAAVRQHIGVNAVILEQVHPHAGEVLEAQVTITVDDGAPKPLAEVGGPARVGG